jgi:hypothetical protein
MIPTPTIFIADHDLECFDKLEHGKTLSDQHTRTAIDDAQQGWKSGKGRQQLLDCTSFTCHAGSTIPKKPGERLPQPNV